METGKTGQYFKYAIGEIILFVIGILIALQINTCNENRKAIALETSFLDNIRQDINNQLSELDIQIETELFF